MYFLASIALAVLPLTAQASSTRVYLCAGEIINVTLTRNYQDNSDELELAWNGTLALAMVPNIAARKGHLAVYAYEKDFGEIAFSLVEPTTSIADEKDLVVRPDNQKSILSIRSGEMLMELPMICVVRDFE